jgi:hypothetical protein
LDQHRARCRGEAVTHRFQPGGLVRLNRIAEDGDAPDVVYEVVRHLPSNSDGENQYRIKSEREYYERVAKESDLETA